MAGGDLRYLLRHKLKKEMDEENAKYVHLNHFQSSNYFVQVLLVAGLVGARGDALRRNRLPVRGNNKD